MVQILTIQNIRNNVFETNSSSTHTLILSKDNIAKTETKDLKWNHYIDGGWGFLDDNRYYPNKNKNAFLDNIGKKLKEIDVKIFEDFQKLVKSDKLINDYCIKSFEEIEYIVNELYKIQPNIQHFNIPEIDDIIKKEMYADEYVNKYNSLIDKAKLNKHIKPFILETLNDKLTYFCMQALDTIDDNFNFFKMVNEKYPEFYIFEPGDFLEKIKEIEFNEFDTAIDHQSQLYIQKSNNDEIFKIIESPNVVILITNDNNIVNNADIYMGANNIKGDSVLLEDYEQNKKILKKYIKDDISKKTKTQIKK